MPGTLFVVATPIGNLEDITTRALRVLREVALIAAEDTRRTAHLLSRYAIATPTTSFHQHNEARKVAGLVQRLQRGDSIALVSDAGTPTISDPGQRLIREAIDAGVRVEPIPGASAALAALAVSGMSGGTFTFLGFPPIRSKDRKMWLDDLRSACRPVIFFEAPHRIRETLQQIHRAMGDRRVAVARELTKTYEELVRGPISEVLTRLTEPRGELTIVIDIGQKTDIVQAKPPDGRKLLAEFSEMVAESALPRRRAVNMLAKRYGLSPNHVYGAIEDARKLVE